MKYFLPKIYIVLLLSLVGYQLVFAQEKKQEKMQKKVSKIPISLRSLQPYDTLNKTRLFAISGVATGAYTGTFLLLNQAWYSQYDRAPFHFFNDNQEWMQMDKVGHAFGGYFESAWFSKAYQWAGVKPKKAAWVGFGAGMLIQGTLEMSDAYSEKWGFSKGDIWANTFGASLFLGQALAWKEQRICMKVSNFPKKYPSDKAFSEDKQYAISLEDKAHALYGKSYIVTFLKDYNAQTLWFSGNIHSFFPQPRMPKYLNVAIGYGTENVFVGDNKYTWTQETTKNGIPKGTNFTIDKDKFPRYRQFYLSLDIDLTKIKTKSPLLRTIFSAVNVLKIPAPALEINSLGKARFHPIYF